MSPDEQSLVQRRPFGGYGVWTGLGQACSGSKSEDIGGVSLPVVHPVLGFKPKITLIGPLDSAVPEQLSDDALATLRESLSNVVRNAEADAGTCVSRGGHDCQDADYPGGRWASTLKSRPAGATPLPGPAPPAGTPRSCGAPSRGPPSPGWQTEPGTTFTWVALPLEGKWEQITELPGETLQSAPTLQRGGHGRTDFGPGPVDRRPLIRQNPPLPQFDQQPGRGG
jgi:hypothetical protein